MQNTHKIHIKYTQNTHKMHTKYTHPQAIMIKTIDCDIYNNNKRTCNNINITANK